MPARRVVQVLLLPHLAQLMRQLDKPLGVAPGEAARAEAEHLHGALIDAAGCCAYHRVLAAVDGGDLPAAGHRGGPDGEGQVTAARLSHLPHPGLGPRFKDPKPSRPLPPISAHLPLFHNGQQRNYLGLRLAGLCLGY